MDQESEIKLLLLLLLLLLLILLHLSDSVQCGRGYYFRAWVLYFSFGTLECCD